MTEKREEMCKKLSNLQLQQTHTGLSKERHALGKVLTLLQYDSYIPAKMFDTFVTEVRVGLNNFEAVLNETGMGRTPPIFVAMQKNKYHLVYILVKHGCTWSATNYGNEV